MTRTCLLSLVGTLGCLCAIQGCRAESTDGAPDAMEVRDAPAPATDGGAPRDAETTDIEALPNPDASTSDVGLSDTGLHPSTTPNVVLIIADDFGTDSLGVYADTTGDGIPDDDRGYPMTPRIASICQSGLRFNAAWSAPTCSPTRAAMLTGRYGFRTGIGSALPRDMGISPMEPTLPKILGPKGFQTANIGKWHLGTTSELGRFDAPRTMGWSHYAGSLSGSLPAYDQWTRTVDGQSTDSNGYATSVNVDDALAWVAQQSSDTPWLLWLAFNAPHSPFHRPPDNLHSVDLDGQTPENQPRTHYRAMVEAMDSEIGRLLDGLEGGIDRPLLVFFLGDNGTPGNIVRAPFDSSRAKDTLYQGGIRVPFCVRGPEVPVASTTDALVHVVDIFATVLDAVGVTPSPEELGDLPSDSVSFWPVITAQASSVRSVVYSESFGGSRPGRGGRTVRDARYKLIVFEDNREEFYDLSQDPLELQELLGAGALDTEAQTSLDALRTALTTFQ